VAVIDVTGGLKMWADMLSYLQSLDRFVELYASAVLLMQKSLQGDDRGAALALAHKLAGTAANLALPALTLRAAKAERVLGSGQDPALDELGPTELASAIDLAVATIHRMTAV
jgi:HPt (histidine-containing phosphotransfer) domain-containing protein